MRPMKKPNTSAATISNTVTIDTVIDSSPAGQAAKLTVQSYLTVFVDEGRDPAAHNREPDKVPPVENLIEYIAAHLRTENS